MAQEFTINSPDIETKINQLLPSQGGFGAGVDFSASTMVIPIVDLTESAEGSGIRQDLQSALSHTTSTEFNVVNTTTTVINTTGYWRITGTTTITSTNATDRLIKISISDGITTKDVWGQRYVTNASGGATTTNNVDLIVFLGAGDSLILSTSTADATLIGSVRQLADVNGNLVNP